MTTPAGPIGEPNNTGPPVDGDAEVAAFLTRELSCVACGYDIRGMSVLGRCPECGLRVATSILAVVDPRAPQFAPIARPRVLAAGVLAWSVGALVAALAAWGIRASQAPELAGGAPWLGPDALRLLAGVGVAGVTASGLGAITLIRPPGQQGRWGVRLALVGVLLYLPLAGVYWVLHGQIDAGTTSPYFARPADGGRTLVRAIELGLIICVALCLRRNARALAARSAVLRSGRVDRQTLLAVAAAALLGIAGDAMRLAANDTPGVAGVTLGIGGVALIVLGAGLLTLGLVGVTIDCVRIASALMRSGRRLGRYVDVSPTGPAPASDA